MDRVLIFGRGYIGSRLAEQLAPVAEVEAVRVELTDLGAIEEAISHYHPQVVINAAAATNTHEIEKPENRSPAFDVNVKGAVNLAYAAGRQGAYLVHLSTGMMFDGQGQDGQGFREDEPPNPTSYYAWTKAWADAALLPFAERQGILIARLHLPLSRFSHPRNLLDKLARWEKALDAQSSFTVLEDFLAALQLLIERRATGIYHLTNPGSMSFYEIIEAMRRHGLVPADREVARVSKEEFDASVAASGGAYQPSCILSSQKALAAGLPLPEIHQAVEACLAHFTPSP